MKIIKQQINMFVTDFVFTETPLFSNGYWWKDCLVYPVM